jgi:predicted 2-oxoglutarate/Fe(II)-dependent dioxygenase YbiX
MSNVSLLQRLGLFVEKDFLSPARRSQLLIEMRSAPEAPVMVMSQSAELAIAPKIDERKRITQQLTPSKSTEHFIRHRLNTLKSTLEQHFQLTFRGYQKPLFYRYSPGGFFSIHQDCSDSPEAPDFLRDRRVSIVIFLNSMTEDLQANSYCGGALTFYGLMNDTRYGFPVANEAGMLVAFRSHLSHEVQRVTAGERYSIVSWFY